MSTNLISLGLLLTTGTDARARSTDFALGRLGIEDGPRDARRGGMLGGGMAPMRSGRAGGAVVEGDASTSLAAVGRSSKGVA